MTAATHADMMHNSTDTVLLLLAFITSPIFPPGILWRYTDSHTIQKTAAAYGPHRQNNNITLYKQSQ